VEEKIASVNFSIFRSGTDLSLLILFVLFFFLLGRPPPKKSKALRFQIWSGWNLARLFLKWIWIDWCSWLFILLHNFKTRAMTSFRADNCCDVNSRRQVLPP